MSHPDIPRIVRVGCRRGAMRTRYFAVVLVFAVLSGCGPNRQKAKHADTDIPSNADTDTDGLDTDGSCVIATDCDSLGAPVCGSWACWGGECVVDCPGCNDPDRGGCGPNKACAAGDCDNHDPDVGRVVGNQACYAGPAGTEAFGTCSKGVESCTNGVWTPCQGEILPSGEACNLQDDDCDGSVDELADLSYLSCGQGVCGTQVEACLGGVLQTCHPGLATGPDNDCDGVDDDCDGAIDEHCAAGCVWVTPAGDDTSGDGTATFPYATIQTAINVAEPSQNEFVCVAAGSSCGAVHVYAGSVAMRDGVHVYAGSVAMRDGVHVYGSFESAVGAEVPIHRVACNDGLVQDVSNWFRMVSARVTFWCRHERKRRFVSRLDVGTKSAVSLFLYLFQMLAEHP